MPVLRRVGRPGLLGMAARTAVVAGTATAVSGAVAQHRQNRAAEHEAAELYAQQQSAPVSAGPVPPPASTGGIAAGLQRLGDLYAQGLLSAEEFALAKQRLLGS